ncbi:hypothetical protein DFR37_11771 [Eoetvoesiella caeni]|uniref:Uncharacterized protein n=1 Tax=Eoetvoesiella caeni TaxID=645616 RepID=A0A366H0T7_9BURK|nr:hypothetical protein DFR37_11771 [Eoetvoesiella caeni]
MTTYNQSNRNLDDPESHTHLADERVSKIWFITRPTLNGGSLALRAGPNASISDVRARLALPATLCHQNNFPLKIK